LSVEVVSKFWWVGGTVEAKELAMIFKTKGEEVMEGCCSEQILVGGWDGMSKRAWHCIQKKLIRG
jgi:hypothetical protein